MYDSAFFQGKGDWNEATFKKNQEVMANLWNEIAELADFNKVNWLVLGFWSVSVNLFFQIAR